ncbi:MAG: alkyldihydroxyacetonephosphate synthase [Actinomycetota bacterium]|jgi:alkyldihydroxyacetonephosphate synthase|nr:alkyldihydroxyacetonephosphate synthase [Actinomycetota bacterium]
MSETQPTAPITIEGDAPAARRPLATASGTPAGLVDRLRDGCEIVDDVGALAESGRDWWPLAMQWALAGEVPGLPVAVARPTSTDEVVAVLRACNDAHVPVTAAGGRSGVCGASVPVHGGVALDLTAMRGIVGVDDTSCTVDVRPGTFGNDFEDALRTDHGMTCGHWPQSMSLSTVGGWLACRGAGQLSTRYGKIEDIVVGLEVVLADGTVVRTGGAPRAAAGPELTQLFVGSEGTLGVITEASLRVHPIPTGERRGAWGFESFETGLEACRRILRRGATPAVLRLYDAAEANRSYQTGELAVLLVMDEADPALVDATFAVVDQECAGASSLDVALVEQWFGHRNDVSALEALTRRGYVVDTMEIAGPWSALPEIYARTTDALLAVPGTMSATAHQSHAYLDGACLYFTFAAKPELDERERYYVAAWDAAQRAVLGAGGALSHHHGVGLNRARFMREALGTGLDVLASIKSALDPNGILNPGKLGLPDAFGEVTWP